MPVTRRQREILDFIAGHLDAKGYAPSFEEIARQFGFHSLATVHEHLTNLERKGYIRRAHNESRAIEIVPPKGQTGATELPLLGLVAAGQPIEAISGNDTIAVPDELVPRRGRSYVLKVRGDSMIDEQQRSDRGGPGAWGQRHRQALLPRAGRVDPAATGQSEHATPARQ